MECQSNKRRLAAFRPPGHSLSEIPGRAPDRDDVPLKVRLSRPQGSRLAMLVSWPGTKEKSEE